MTDNNASSEFIACPSEPQDANGNILTGNLHKDVPQQLGHVSFLPHTSQLQMLAMLPATSRRLCKEVIQQLRCRVLQGGAAV